MSRFFRSLAALRELIQSGRRRSHSLGPGPAVVMPVPPTPREPGVGATTVHRLQPISVRATVPAHRVAAVQAELDFNVQRILQKALDEDRLSDARSTLLLLGLRVDEPVAGTARVLH